VDLIDGWMQLFCHTVSPITMPILVPEYLVMTSTRQESCSVEGYLMDKYPRQPGHARRHFPAGRDAISYVMPEGA
jgi:hypothetical protein